MGEPNNCKKLLSIYEYIVYGGKTWGTETSKYPQEKKENFSILQVVASESRKAQTISGNTYGVRTTQVTEFCSRNVLEKHTKESESLVSETKRRTVVSRVVQDTRNPV